MRQQYSSAGVPNGDAFIVGTPQTDAARDQLLADQRQREMFAQRQAMATDQELAKEFANVRQADMPELMKRYQNYKDIQIDLMRNPKLLNDQMAYNKRSQEGVQALGGVHALINDSHEAKKTAEDLNRLYPLHADKFADDYKDKMNAYINTPTYQLGDLRNPESFMYQGANTDWGKIDKNARGVINKGSINAMKTAPSPDDPYSDVTTGYHFGNDPLTYKNNFLGALQSHAAGRDAAAAWDKLQTEHPDWIQHVNEAYQNLPAEKWQGMGLQGPQDLEPVDPNNKAEQFAAYNAKGYAVNAPLQAATPITKINQSRLIAAKQENFFERNKVQFAERKIIANITSANTTQRQQGELDAKQAMANMSAARQDRFTNDTFDAEVAAAKANKPETITTGAGQHVTAWPMTSAPVRVIADEFKLKQGSHEITPDSWYTDGKDYIGVFKVEDSEGNEEVKTLKKPISALKPVWKKAYGSTVKDDASEGTPAPAPAVPHKTIHKGAYDNF